MKVLGVDDNPDIIQLLEMTIESLGHEFDSVLSGREGLEKIRDGGFDMVFLDLSMPDFTGMDVINSLVEDGTMSKSNIVLFTASYLGLGKLEEDLQKKGVHSILTKPADIDQIIDKVNEIEATL